MEADIKKLCLYIEQQLMNPICKAEAPKLEDESSHILLKSINMIFDEMQELYKASLQLADGNLQIEINKENMYAGALKDLQASLKHLIWQVGRIAKGEYQIRVEFMGDITDSFERLIHQLKDREMMLKENLQLHEELIEQQTISFEKELNRKAEQYNQYVKSMEEIRSYRHDMKNHLLCISSLLHEKDITGADKYISSLTDIFTKLNQLEQSENSILDALLNEKLERARNLQVKVTKHIQIPRKLHIENKDWCILIGNALDNCLEALEQIPLHERVLTIKIINVNRILSVQIKNTFQADIAVINNSVNTTKNDQINHGIGLKNMEKVVNHYQGELEIKAEENMFCLTFILCDV